MKANELMIGDWVIDTEFGRNEIDRVECIEPTRVWLYNGKLYTPIKYLKPVPLTPEILEKNGLEHKHAGEPIKRQYWIVRTNGGSIKAKINGGLPLVDIIGMPAKEGFICPLFNAHIQYVHQLQHALRLCGIEKTIEL